MAARLLSMDFERSRRGCDPRGRCYGRGSCYGRAMSDGRSRSVWVLAVGWALVAASCAALVARGPELPDPLPVLRTFAGETTRWAPRSTLTVARVGLLGAAQLGAVTAVLLDIRVPADGPWARLFRAGTLAVGAKTALEAAGFAALGTPHAAVASDVTLGAVLAVVAAFLARAASLWRGGMGPLPQVSMRAQIGVGVSLAGWAGIALLPLVLPGG